MTNPNKNQGTDYERKTEQYANNHGFKAWRLAEHGQNDQGDIELIDDYGDHWILETRHRQVMQPHKAHKKAKRKADTADRDAIVRVAVLWKRIVKKPGKTVRQPTGTREIVILSKEDFFDLLKDPSRRGRW